MPISIVRLPLAPGKERIRFYLWTEGGRSPVQDFLESLQQADLDKMMARMQRYAEQGRLINPEHFKRLKGYSNLYEFKTFRVRVFCFLDEDRMVLVEGCFKRSEKVIAPVKAAMDRADARKRAYFDQKREGLVKEEER